jgi:hypothetical protein
LCNLIQTSIDYLTAAKEEWQPFDGFSNRVLARIEHEENSAVLIDRIAWRILPFTAAASLATAVVAAMGEFIPSVIYSTISDPFAIEQIIALISG